ncbi:hypothetical protein CC80DRAFT_179336 [Byssothecium circinans]|uniref:Uncharacterized protein n=1 Tax=Byssothecium circinans TaxID=147558 RepID=A0A6A5TKX5_9PLEO|nr:hypothetical protein CC80DRAFT_179336 [Byssothecium circinans]
MEKGYSERKAPWLAITLGCCGDRKESMDGDDGREALRSPEESEMRICYEQPAPTPHPIASPTQTRPVTSHSMSQTLSQWASQSRDFATRASSRASVNTLTRPRKSHSRPRPSIGRPMDFRHNDSIDGIQSMLDDAPMPVRRRRSFQPLELSIYLPDGRLSPLPDFDEDDWVKKPEQALVRNRDSRTDSITSISGASGWLIQRKPVGSGSRRSSVQSTQSSHSRTLSGTISTLPFLLEEEPKARTRSSASSPTLIQRSNTLSPRKALSRLPSPSRSRANTAPSSRPSSIRKFKTGSTDSDEVDAAIRELNTIVEERRADAYRSANFAHSSVVPPSPSSHVPAIAPSLRMKVRSETLSDIGSAFSAPLVSKPLPKPPAKKSGLRLEPPKRTFSGPLDSNPITPPTPTVPTPTTSIYRLKGWLKRSLPNTPSTASFKSAPATPSHKSFRSSKSSKPETPSTPFYQCEPTPTHHRDISQQYFDMEPHSSSRPASSTSSSRSMSMTHTRHTSNETATVTLLSSYPSSTRTRTPSLLSSTSTISHNSITLPLSPPSTKPTPNRNENETAPANPARTNILKGAGKTRRIPAPLTLSKAKEKEIMVEACLGSAKSFASTASGRSRGSAAYRASRGSLKPPPSPNYGILRGMEISARGEGVLRSAAERVLPSPGAVGVAF